MSKKLYDVLGVSEDASHKDIRSAYRKLAKKLHPDLNPGNKNAEEEFKEVSSAFAILGDEEKRKLYDVGKIDEAGAEAPQHQYYRQYADTDAHHHYNSTAGFDDLGDLGDLFSEAFARRGGTQYRPGGSSMPFPGADVRYHMTISFLEAVTGTKKRVTMPDGGTLDVSIPAGIKDGQTLRLNGKGEPGSHGAPPGDAHVSIEVQPHKLFERDGDNIVIKLPIGLHEAVLGRKVEVPTISGSVSMTVPKGASSGQVLRLRGLGIKTNKSKGDQLVHLKIIMPDTIDDDLNTFMSSWAETHDYNPRNRREFKP